MKNSPSTVPFWQIWQDHEAYLFTQSLRLMGGNPEDARDALHMTMLRAYAYAVKRDQALVDARAWLGRILHNVCMDIHRERRRFVEHSTEEPTREQEAHDLGAAAPSSEQLLLGNERAREVQACIQTLPRPLREPLVLRFLHDMSYPDIAERLRLTNANARKRVQLAYGLLRLRLAHLAPSHQG